MKVKIVCGYVESAFPARHLTSNQFRALGLRLKNSLPEDDVIAFDSGWKLEDCWAAPFLDWDPPVLPADRNPPADRYATPRDAVISNVVLLQRYQWMQMAAEAQPDVDVFAWLEYSIFKQSGITEARVREFVKQIAEHPFDAISYPGQWSKGPIDDTKAHWRFSGSTWVCPRRFAAPLNRAVQDVVKLRTALTRRLSWDMNSVAFVELLEVLPFRWYPGGHNETQLTNYLKT